MAPSFHTNWFLLACIVVLLPSCVNAFGAGNIASISAVEGKNWRHGDIEDVLKTVACIKGHKWTSIMIKRVYFGNWLRDYSQAMDVGALKKAQPETIRILVWLLSFLSFGYATAEFEVTPERLGVYRPEEHIDNPKNYNDDQDATQYDKRLRGIVRPVELEIDHETGMKNYIANGKGDWATSAAFVKYSFERSIHHGRLYMNGQGWFKGKDDDLAEGLRLLGQGLHTLEDFGAHTNYVELALREQGYHNIFTHTGAATEINLRGKRVFPLVTGTFGMVDFYHSVLGEATDHFTQSEVDEMDNAMQIAESSAQSSNPLTTLIKLLSKVPGTRDLCQEAEQLQRASQMRAREINQGGTNIPGQGGYRGVNDDVYGGTTRAPPGTSFDSGFPGQPHWQQQAAHDSNSWTQGSQNYNQPPQPAWGQQQQYQAYKPLSQPAQPQWNSPQHPQSFNMQDSSSYPPQPPQWQQQQPHQPPQHQSTSFDQQQQNFTPQHTPAQPQQTFQSAPAGLPGMPNFDPAKTMAQIYPILAFRDKVVRNISAVIEKIPGLEALVDRITETLTVFVLSLLAPFVRPVIKALTASLQAGSTGVVESSAHHQYEPWTDPHCTDPTHSMLSKDHFSNILNSPAGMVAAEIVKFIGPRVLYAWEHPNVPVQQVLEDVDRIFHHPAIRNEHVEVHRNMFEAVRKWVRESPRAGDLNVILSSEGVKSGKNQKGGGGSGHAHGSAPAQHQQQPQQQASGFSIGGFDVGNMASGFMGGGHSGQQQQQQQQHGGSQSGGFGDVLGMASKLPIPGMSNLNKINKYANMMGSFGGKRELDEDDKYGVGGEIGGRREIDHAVSMHGQGLSGQHRSVEEYPPTQAPRGYESYSGGHGEYRGEDFEGQQPQQHYQGHGGQGGYGGGDGGYDQYQQQQGGPSGSYYDGGGSSEGYYRS